MIRCTPRSPRVDTLFPYTTLFGAVPVLADRPAPELGPLGGLCAALCHAAETGHAWVLTLGCDMPRIDAELLARLTAPGPGRHVAEAPIVGHWPTALADPLLRHLSDGGERAVRRWAATTGIEAIAEIGRASCRERVCQYGLMSVVAVSLKKKNTTNNEDT